MRTVKLKIDNHKDTGAYEFIYDLLYEKFKEDHKELNEDELDEMFYKNVVENILEYGEFISLEVDVDENLNIIGGKIIPHNKKHKYEK